MAKSFNRLISSDYSKIETNLPAVLIKCSVSDALDHWKNREDYPDFLGLCYNHVSEALIRSIESNDFERFKKYIEDILTWCFSTKNTFERM